MTGTENLTKGGYHSFVHLRDTARDLSALIGELAALKEDATHWLTDPEYACPQAPPGGRARGEA
jgi:hypothetical protein